MDHELPPAPVAAGTNHERLWTPWRMQYIGSGNRVAGCVFCERLRDTEDRTNLILHRGAESFLIMNLYPYNTGHIMIVPNAHIASPEDAPDSVTAEMAGLRGPLLRALRRALSCQGFNLGLNVGAEAGAGIAAHMHEHVVPRWLGDANFMPILANTMVLPELLPVTYAKLRAEIGRELHHATEVELIVFDPSGERVIASGDGTALRATLVDSEPVWRTAANLASRVARSPVALAGWAGGCAEATELRLAFVANEPEKDLDDTWRWQSVSTLSDGTEGQTVTSAAELLTSSSSQQS